jgi:outer membrane immunogenic protein
MRFTLSAAIISGALVLSGSTAFAADLLLVPEPIAEVAPSWADGFYVGVHAGYGFGMADHQPATPVGPGGNGFDANVSGAMLGGQVGGWWHITDGIMGGVQLDADWSNITGSVVAGGPVGTVTYTVNWLATAEGRLGFDAGGFVPYVSLGVAAAGATRTASGTGVSSSMVHPGLSVGAGAAFMITDQLSADIEARWQGFAPRTYNTGGTPPSVALGVSSIRAGLNFHF